MSTAQKLSAHCPCGPRRHDERLPSSYQVSRLMVEVARMGSESTVWSFIRTFRKHWFAAMSGGVSVPFAAAPAFIDNGYAQIVLALLALTAAWFAHIAYGKRREIRSSRFKTGCRAKSDYFCTPTKLERREELKLVKAAAGRNCRISRFPQNL